LIVGQFEEDAVRGEKTEKTGHGKNAEKTGQTQFFRGQGHREISHASPRKNWV
jgi:hypothetical protein